MSSNKIKVLIIDDSALVRKMLSEIITSAPDMDVVGTASDPLIARNKIKLLNPDVLTLDVEMPKMDGLTFLKNLMRLRPMPVVMISTLTEKGAEVTFEALEVGAVDFIAKPKFDFSHDIHNYTREILQKIRTAAKAKIGQSTVRKRPVTSQTPRPKKQIGFSTTDKIIAIGASTGGTEAIKEVLTQLSSDVPGILITQHIPVGFSARFAERLNGLCSLKISEAKDGDQVLPGRVLIAPGDRHLELERDGARYVCRLSDGPNVSSHKPSVDVLFHSVAEVAGKNAMGVLLTGMGSDGARGLLEIKKTGALTVAQDEASSVVWGMPGEAVKQNAVDKILPLSKVHTAITAHFH